MDENKSYVDMSTVDPETAIAIGDAIRSKGGRFLEAPVSGSKGPAQLGEVLFSQQSIMKLFLSLLSCVPETGHFTSIFTAVWRLFRRNGFS